MANIFFWSDTHTDHANILTFTGSDGQLIRPGFANVKEMAEYMVERHNATVGPNDHVYHVGDVCMNKRNIKTFMERLHGKHRLVLGNHDPHDMKILMDAGFEKIFGSRLVDNYLVTHFPVHPDHIGMRAKGNIHGHIHQNPSPRGPYFNVSVEALDYTPIALEDIKRLIDLKVDFERREDERMMKAMFCVRCGSGGQCHPGCY